MDLESKIESIVNQEIKNSDIFLVGIKATQGKISVFVDTHEGVTIDECTQLSRSIGERLEDEIMETHSLEVSSPGLDNPLKVHGQYIRNVGKDLSVTMSNGEKISGKLLSADDKNIHLMRQRVIKENKKKKTVKDEIEISFDDILESRIELKFK
jgi:ribosome maturation factor RimP